MKELQVMEGLDTPVRHHQEYPQKNIKRKKRRRRQRLLHRFRRYFLATMILLAAVFGIFLLVQGGKFLFQKIAGSHQEVFFEASPELSKQSEEPLIVLDAGHGGTDHGTGGGELLEKDVNLKVVKLVKKQLQKEGLRVLLTRESDSRVELSQRSTLANEKKAAVFVSIHCNFCEDSSKVKGIECYYMEGSEGGKTLAEELDSQFEEQEKIVNRGVRTADFHVLRETKMPAVLIELGYFSNSEEKEKLGSKSYQQLLAECIAEAISESVFLHAEKANDSSGEGEFL